MQFKNCPTWTSASAEFMRHGDPWVVLCLAWRFNVSRSTVAGKPARLGRIASLDCHGTGGGTRLRWAVLDRVKTKTRPSHSGAIKDSIHLEHFLNLSRLLTAAGFAEPRVFVSSNSSDFALDTSKPEDLHTDLVPELSAAGLEFFGSLGPHFVTSAYSAPRRLPRVSRRRQPVAGLPLYLHDAPRQSLLIMVDSPVYRGSSGRYCAHQSTGNLIQLGKLKRADLVFPFEAPMARVIVKELRPRNYRAFADARLVLGDVTFLFGRNGAGKSTLMHAFGFVSEAVTDSLGTAMEQRGNFLGLFRATSATSLDRASRSPFVLIAGKSPRPFTVLQSVGIRDERVTSSSGRLYSADGGCPSSRDEKSFAPRRFRSSRPSTGKRWFFP